MFTAARRTTAVFGQSETRTCLRSLRNGPAGLVSLPRRLASSETATASLSSQPAAQQVSSAAVGSATTSAADSTSSKALYYAGGFVVLLMGMFGGVIYLSRQRSQDEALVRSLPLIPGNPVVYLDIGNNGEKIGRIVIQLRKDVCPKAAENFAGLCTHSHGYGFRSSPLHGGEKYTRIFAGDFYANGAGGYSIYGPTFPDEDLVSLKHVGPGVVAMRNTGPDTNNSQFYIALRRLPEFDGLSQVVGHVVEGFELLQELDKHLDTSSYGNSRFQKGYDFRILGSGLMPPDYQKPGGSAGGDDEASAAKELNDALAGAMKEDAQAAREAARAVKKDGELQLR